MSLNRNDFQIRKSLSPPPEGESLTYLLRGRVPGGGRVSQFPKGEVSLFSLCYSSRGRAVSTWEDLGRKE